MKHLLILLLTFTFSVTAISDDFNYNIHLGSYHYDRDRDWNEINLGAGIDYNIDDSKFIAFGYYNNSFDEDSFYILGGFTAKIFTTPYGNIKIQPFLGAASGYDHDEAPLILGARILYKNVNVVVAPYNLGFSYYF